MKYEIKQINNTDAVVISDGKIKENTNTFKEGINGDWFWCSKYNKIARTGDITSFDFKIIATVSPFKIEGLHMLELDNQEEDVEIDKLAVNYCIETKQNNRLHYFIRNIFRAGYKAAQNKKYSEEDIIKAIEMAREADSLDGTVDLHIILNYPNADNSDLRVKWTEEEILQSLQKKQFPTSVELTEDLQVIKWYYEKES